ncbi:MAG: hypothetical protein NTZ51_08335 [Proteobacteria bacterium]|nr:hypothetical protein [Pseudomonadota bacterium]
MAHVSRNVKDKLHAILVEDYAECQSFFDAASILKDKITTITALTEKEEIDFNMLRDTIGELGIHIRNIEKGLYEIEDCYTKLVEALER